jgi:hypothetical protein
MSLCKVVEDVSSIIGDAFEGKATIQANHMDMCRFRDRNGSDYLLVSGVIRRWSRMAIELSFKQDLIITTEVQSQVHTKNERGRPTSQEVS